MKYYSIPDITASYRISPSVLKQRIMSGQIQAKKQRTSYNNEKMFKWLIPETELVKLEYCKGFR